ncbi:MAG: hypothetical protein COX81_01790 [Candidatus Magasanikbacteria bacterium CG_4_10_14_0_2_um_filter_37_12]|uniref:Uncharacterized protein n=1 Tax=Candidatus Magasanikbacteria bacterium CG_4_10_14_0_2_um_filter_37_12 TaxID=1974637 RepID=A0A2M7V8J0_9BACT|nr:MAG: hypothetical protein COX81_01790 [Candidatus Magasanikbacteria bacterium CG_4_10_14_0_2_um_filter_37_12]
MRIVWDKKLDVHVYMKMVIPDDHVIIQPNGFDGEKEILLKKSKDTGFYEFILIQNKCMMK